MKAWKTSGGHRRISSESVSRLQDEQLRATGSFGNTLLSTIVVVEADPVYRELYRLKIASWRLAARVATAKDGFEGLLKIGKLNPQLVITDLRLPGMDGFQMIHALQKLASDLDVVVVTGLSDDEIKQSGGLPKSVTVLEKPDPLAQLEKRLRARFAALAD